MACANELAHCGCNRSSTSSLPPLPPKETPVRNTIMLRHVAAEEVDDGADTSAGKAWLEPRITHCRPPNHAPLLCPVARHEVND